MRRKIPSTHALSAFESAARHQSFTKAADELAVTQSAVCRQIGALESFLGVKLFRRTRRGVALTDAGAAYSRRVASRLDEIEYDALEVMAKGTAFGTLELAVVPTFATKWLLPRLPAFTTASPGITVNLTARTRPFLFGDTQFDAAIHAGAEAWAGTERTLLMRESLIAVASPSLIAPRKNLTPRDWSSYPLLQQSTRPFAWRNWFAAQGIEFDGDMIGPRLELFSMLAGAAVAGLGIALIPRFLIEDELNRGILIPVCKYEHQSENTYYLIYPEERTGNTALSTFRAWLEHETRQARSTVRPDS
ncbi:LysR family transcriptional regulator (plasmid) [Paraburkholderia sprentiae WSM5005]|uniref:LysR family transcriptional regulator n=1 Tax=Paraburkholderia sprentiae WSM5005 TaxID=754502 RepID=A0A1I9YWA5_9BURK|nr:LysR family transcriptional regulator [Paraburkholderia sprentiae]APA90512.1 LysR family transcriptional regulator [Paraburkholderia sprentiae WSM5005]